jgi:pimeloyl-ACP methyl ester carboxylesterase
VNHRVAARSSARRRVLVSAVVAATGVAILSGRRRVLDRRSRIRWSTPVASNVSHPLAARVIGHGPPIALLHGLGASNRYWGSAYDYLGVGHRLVVPDLLGFGASPRPDHGYGPDEHAEAIAACLGAAEVLEPAVLAAHSAGVIVALRLAATRPELVRAVIAVGPPIYKNAQDARRHLAALGAMARLFANDGHLAEVTCRWVCKHRDTAAKLAVLGKPDLPAEIARDGVQHSWNSYSETLTGLLLASNASDWFDDIDVPVVLIAGDRDAACDLGWLRTLSAQHPNVRLEIWNGDHHLPLTDPEAIIQRIEAT